MSKIIKNAVYETANVETVKSFKKMDGNRTINNIHVKNIKEGLRNSLDLFPPITVNSNTLNIIDGQHRVTAFLELVNSGELPTTATLDVKYVNISPEDERECAVNANTCSKNWQLVDYINSFSITNENYRILLDWCQKHPLCYPNVSKTQKEKNNSKRDYRFRFASAILKQKSCATELKNGTLVITEDDLINASTLYAEIETILNLLPSKPSALEYVAIKWCSVRNFQEWNTWIKYIKKMKDTKKFMELPRNNARDWEVIFNQILAEIYKKEDNK